MAKKKEPVVHDRGELAFVTLCGIFFGVGGTELTWLVMDITSPARTACGRKVNEMCSTYETCPVCGARFKDTRFTLLCECVVIGPKVLPQERIDEIKNALSILERIEADPPRALMFIRELLSHIAALEAEAERQKIYLKETPRTADEASDAHRERVSKWGHEE